MEASKSKVETLTGITKTLNLNNNARILDIALVDHLVYDKPILNTLIEYKSQPHLYQYILQAGRTYEGTFDNNKVKLQKVNRVFAANQSTTPYVLYKVKM